MDFQRTFERWGQPSLFFIGIIVLIIPIFSFNLFVNLDGPFHIENTVIFNRLLASDSFSEQFYEFNPELTSNYLTLLIYTPFYHLFGISLGWKIVNLVYVLTFIYSLYLFVNSFKTNKKAYPFIIFPLVYSLLFISGFYNFILALPMLFFALTYYERCPFKKPSNYIILSILLTVLYLCHSIVFSLAFLYIGSKVFVKIISKSISTKDIWKTILSLVPALLLTLLFLGGREANLEYQEMKTLIGNLTKGSSLIFKSEYSLYFQLTFVFTLLFLTIYLGIKNFKKNIHFLVIAFGLLLAYFILPDSFGYASVFSVRIEYFLWLILGIYITINSSNLSIVKTILSFTSVIIVCFQIYVNLPYWSTLNNHANAVLKASELIEEHSIVYPIFNSNYWDDLHLSNLLGAEKNILVLENNYARHDYFPVKYKTNWEEIIEEQKSLKPSLTNGQTINVDYLFIMGKNTLERELHIQLYQEAMENGEMILDNNDLQVWKINH